MNIKVKRTLQCVCFLLCVVLVVLTLLNWFGYPAMDEDSRTGKMRFARFYSEEKDTVQGVLIGTSSVHREWASPVAYEEYGIAMYALSSSAQPVSLAISILREAKATQDIDYAVVDLRGIRMSSLGKSEETYRHCLDNMPLSVNRFQAVKQILEYNEIYNSLVSQEEQVKMDASSLYFPFLKYHTRWSNGLTAEDFSVTGLDMKSVCDDSRGFKVKQVKPLGVSYDEGVELNELQIKVLDNLVDYADEAGITLIFISSPASLSRSDRSEIHAAQNYLTAKGCNVVDMMTTETFEEMDLDFDEDYRDSRHLNLKGSLKFTRYFCEYLKANYDIPDVRGQEGYESWDMAAENFWTYYDAGWTAKEESEEGV